LKKLKLYLETTVFNWYFEPTRGFVDEIQLLFDEIASGKFEAFASEYVVEELMETEGPKREMLLGLLQHSNVTILRKSEEAEALADAYALHAVISERHEYDRWHLGCATVNGMDAIISFNFSHINRRWTKDRIGAVNHLNGYGNITINLPMEVTGNADV
jgi:hypothetical protein